tara:strand:- start:281 stop:2146 length:1866 start_codon:yes stop_codon:yes gene_type:complete
MKKIIIPMLALITSGAYSQTYFEDDFSGGIGSWTLTDSDGDGFDWAIADYGAGDGHGNVASSASWDGGAGILTPDNWMVAGPFDLSAATGTVAFQWVTKAQDPDWTGEEYTAYAGTSGAIGDLMTSPYSFNEVVGGTGGEYVSRSLDVTALSGESDVYIAFRHHNVSDEFRLNIDDVSVRTLLDWDLKMLSVTTAPVVEEGTINITGSVKNNGANTITSFDLDWNDGTSHNETITETIEPGEVYNFTHPTALSAVSGEAYDMDVCADLADDGDATNDCINTVVSCVSEIPTKYVVGEEKTGTWCGWCPRGAVALEEMESEPLFIGIAVHNGDPMTVAAYDTGINTYVPGGYPGGGVDRVIPGDPSDFASMYATRSSHIPPASVSVSYVEVGANIEVTVTAEFVGALSGDYRLAAVVIENDVTGTASGYNQANYYSGGDAGEMGGYEDLANPVSAADMVYDHVARALGNNEILGDAGSLPGTITSGTGESYTYTFAKGAEWDLNELHFVGMLVDGSTGEILNAGQTVFGYAGIEEENAEFELSVFPNPSNGLIFVKVSLVETSDVNVEIYNALGELVYSENTQNLTSGAYLYSVDVSAFSAGMYTVRTIVNNTVQTAKLSVQ